MINDINHLHFKDYFFYIYSFIIYGHKLFDINLQIIIKGVLNKNTLSLYEIFFFHLL